MRRALDQVPDPVSEVDRILMDAGLLVPWPDDDDEEPLSDDELAALEEEHEAWLKTLPEPLGLSEAVIEDRR